MPLIELAEGSADKAIFSGRKREQDGCTGNRVRRQSHRAERSGIDLRHIAVAADHFAGEEIHLADEVGDLAAVGRFIELARAATCRILPPDITATRSDIESASSWSWVTKTKVMPTSSEGAQLDLHRFAQPFVERAQRFVEQQNLGPAHQRAGQRHALALAAGQLVGARAPKPVEPDHRQRVFDPARSSVARQRSLAQAIGDIVEHIEVRKNRVGLEHHVGGPPVRRHVGHALAVERDRAAVGKLEARDHAQQGGLAAARRSQQREEFAAPDREV